MSNIREIENKNTHMKYIELKEGVSIEELLHTLYIEEQRSIREIGEELGIHYHTVNKWLKMAGIDTRLPHQKLLDLVEIKRKLKENC